MDYWEKWNKEKMEREGAKGGITLIDQDNEDKVLNISLTEFGSIKFVEGCDEYYSMTFSNEDAIKVLKEAFAWIKDQAQAISDYKVIYEDEISGVQSHIAAAKEAFKVVQKISGANFEVVNLATGSQEMVYCETEPKNPNTENEKEAEEMFESMLYDLRDNHFCRLGGHRTQNDLTKYGVERSGTIECKTINILYAGNGPTAKFEITTKYNMITSARLMFQAFGKPIYKDLYGKDLEMIKQEFHEVIHGH